MTENISVPSFNPAEINSQSGLLTFFGQILKSSIQKVIPARIISYERTTNRAVVQILSYDTTAAGNKLITKPIPNIPVMQISGGGFTLSFPVEENQLGWLITADVDISTFKTTQNMFTPASYRQHQYEDGLFIPNNLNSVLPGGENSDAVVLTSLDGKTQITLQNNLVSVSAEKIVLNGNLNVNGTIKATGDISGANISLSKHTHGGVQTGSGNTGVPQ